MAGELELFGIDIDDVLLNLMPALCSWHNSAYGTSLTQEHFDSQEYLKVWGGTWSETREKIRTFYGVDDFKLLEPVDGAIAGMAALRKKYELVAITARPEWTREVTELQISQHFPDAFARIVFTNHYEDGNRRTKSDVCKELGIRKMVEDNLEHAEDCISKGIKVFLLDRPWNRSKDIPGVVRVHSWKELVGLLAH